MKRFLMTMTMVMMTMMGANAMSYSEARDQALYLTDKMAYELNLTDRQYEDLYEINLDYLMGLRTADDIYGQYWVHRNADIASIFLDWQWRRFMAIDYFYRPIVWVSGTWSFPVYRYYDRGLFYRSRPTVYVSYRGGHGRLHYSDGYYARRYSRVERPHSADRTYRRHNDDRYSRPLRGGSTGSYTRPDRGGSTGGYTRPDRNQNTFSGSSSRQTQNNRGQNPNSRSQNQGNGGGIGHGRR